MELLFQLIFLLCYKEEKKSRQKKRRNYYFNLTKSLINGLFYIDVTTYLANFFLTILNANVIVNENGIVLAVFH